MKTRQPIHLILLAGLLSLSGCQAARAPSGSTSNPPSASPPSAGAGTSAHGSTASAAPGEADATPLTGSGKPRGKFRTFAPGAGANPAPEPPSEAERLRAPGSTRGSIACGSTRCEAERQACVPKSGEWQCVSVDSEELAGADARHDCDDASDCRQGQICCLSFGTSLEQYLCSARSGKGSTCSLEVCSVGDGAACGNGQVCRDGVCRAPNPGALCAGVKCPPQEPLCLWSDGVARCVPPSEATAPRTDEFSSVLHCSGPRDCGKGERCCGNAIWNASYCQLQCDPANTPQICTKAADCAALPDREKPRCEPVRPEERGERAFPPWLKVCRHQ